GLGAAHHSARLGQWGAAADNRALLHPIRTFHPGERHFARHRGAARRARGAQGAHRHERRGFAARPPEGRRRRADRLAVLYPAGSEGRQGAPYRARSHPRHPEELGLPSEPQAGGSELGSRYRPRNTGGSATQSAQLNLRTGRCRLTLCSGIAAASCHRRCLRVRSQALFRPLLLPSALDRPCDLLVLLGRLREAVLPQALRPGAVPLRRLLLARLFLACPRSTSAAFLVLRGARTSTPTFAMSCSTARSSTLCAVSPAALR